MKIEGTSKVSIDEDKMQQASKWGVYAEVLYADYLEGGNAFEIDFSNWHPKFIGQKANVIRKKNPSDSDFLNAVIYSHGLLIML